MTRAIATLVLFVVPFSASLSGAHPARVPSGRVEVREGGIDLVFRSDAHDVEHARLLVEPDAEPSELSLRLARAVRVLERSGREVPSSVLRCEGGEAVLRFWSASPVVGLVLAPDAAAAAVGAIELSVVRGGTRVRAGRLGGDAGIELVSLDASMPDAEAVELAERAVLPTLLIDARRGTAALEVPASLASWAMVGAEAGDAASRGGRDADRWIRLADAEGTPVPLAVATFVGPLGEPVSDGPPPDPRFTRLRFAADGGAVEAVEWRGLGAGSPPLRVVVTGRDGVRSERRAPPGQTLTRAMMAGG